MKRLFAAIHIVPDPHFLSVFADLKSRLRTEKIRWVEPQNMHITIKFFGETPFEKMIDIKQVFKKSVTNLSPLKLTLKKTGIFGSRYKPRLIWFGIEENKQLFALSNEIFSKLNETGFPIDRQNFIPHLSLGRLKSVQNKIKFQQTIDLFRDVFVQDIKVDSITLFESKLHPDGVTYNAIEQYYLKEGSSWQE